MSIIRSRKKSTLLTSSMVAMAGSLAIPAHAQDAPVLKEVNVQAAVDVPYKTEKSASNKLTQALVDTPKTVQVLKKEMLKEQGASSLMEALRNTAGITMQLGENGNTAAGDTFQMRGFSTNTSTFVDGVRDLGAVTRDVFNLEQVEVVKGAGGSEVGRGASAGYINLISKLPTLEQANDIALTLGTADKKRLTVDSNNVIDDSTALRLNVMVQEGNAEERNQVSNRQVAIAPSLAFGLDSPTKVYLYSQHIRQDNVPDGGVPTIGMEGFYNSNTTIKAGAKVSRDNFYGSQQDYEKISADMLTAKVEHQLSKNTTIRNISRYGQTHVDRVLTGVNALSVNASTKAIEVALNRQRIDQTNEIWANQTNLNTALSTGFIKHDLVLGLELLKESQLTLGSTSGSTSTTTVVVNGQTLPVYSVVQNVYSPNAYQNLLVPYLTGADTDGETTTAALYVFDTLTLIDSLKFSLGLRADRYKTETSTGTMVTGGSGGNLATYSAQGYKVGDVVISHLEDDDTLLSWNAGLVFKPATNGSIYVAFADAQTPPAGANFVLSATAGNQANAELDPQQTTTAELGTKWELLNKRLNVSAAVYRTENDKQASVDAVTGVANQEGKTLVDGIELAAVGQLTNFWQLTMSVGFMESEQLGQSSKSSSTGVITTSDGVRWTPDVTASVWTSYTLEKFTFGGGARYVGEQKRVVTTNANLATENMPVIPAYTVADVMAAYKVNKNTNLRLNVYNVFDEEYISTLNNSGARMTLGAPISAAITAEFSF
ncbi:TonB-dependent receptor [uncultured Agitococcus sp.]|uniref:TonB-dependent receptor domain-containing protein n=1 Tax=uncultured Agitococcus sp. TaxID=1506599 RepID=UPI00262D4270|nr:TonB-dependent receptor [uncultured Agitococcus sp.]